MTKIQLKAMESFHCVPFSVNILYYHKSVVFFTVDVSMTTSSIRTTTLSYEDKFCVKLFQEIKHCPPLPEPEHMFGFLHNYTNPRPITARQIIQAEENCSLRLYLFFLKKHLEDISPFLSALFGYTLPLFWASGDVCPEFQNMCGSPRLYALLFLRALDSPLVSHLLTISIIVLTYKEWNFP